MTEIDDSRVWMLGTHADGVGKSINWIPKEIPSFADCDILVVDTTSLNEKLISSMDIENVDKIYTEITKRFETGLLIICISSQTFDGGIPDEVNPHSTYRVNSHFWSPIGYDIHEIPKGKTLKKTYSKGFLFDKYVDSITQWGLALRGQPFYKSYHSDERGEMVNAINIIASNSNDVLGGEFQKSNGHGGSFIILPPLETSQQSIHKILEIIGVQKQTAPPSWINKIKIPTTTELETQIQALQNEIQRKQSQINELSEKLQDKNKLKKLVYATDKELELIVKQALELLGLRNIREGENGKDDLLFDFPRGSDHKLCSIEVKGIEGNLKLKDLRQLGNWVDDHLDAKIKAKGLIISNTYRLNDIEKSKKERSEIESDNLEYAVRRGFCILPTHVLLDLCMWVLDGNNINIKKIEDSIMKTNGIIRLDDLK